MAVSDVEAVEIIDALAAAGVRSWLVGGWGVDALAERVTRTHRDVDLMVLGDHLERAVGVLVERGFRVTTDWLPVRIELDDGIHVVDLHPMHPSPAGGWWQAAPEGGRYDYPVDAWTSGLLGGRTVECACVALQLAAHSSYEPRPVDGHDLAVLQGLIDGSEASDDAPGDSS